MLESRVPVYSIPGKLEVQWAAGAKAIIDGWLNYGVSLADFREAVLVRGLNYAKQNGGRAWVVDSSRANGLFSDEIQKFIGTDVFPAFAKSGIKYFATISSKSSLTNLSIGAYKAKLGPNGMKLLELGSVEQALQWLKAN